MIIQQLNDISLKENINVNSDAMNVIYDCSQGDLRKVLKYYLKNKLFKAIMYLHTGSLFVSNKILTIDDVVEICGVKYFFNLFKFNLDNSK